MSLKKSHDSLKNEEPVEGLLNAEFEEEEEEEIKSEEHFEEISDTEEEEHYEDPVEQEELPESIPKTAHIGTVEVLPESTAFTPEHRYEEHRVSLLSTATTATTATKCTINMERLSDVSLLKLEKFLDQNGFQIAEKKKNIAEFRTAKSELSKEVMTELNMVKLQELESNIKEEEILLANLENQESQLKAALKKLQMPKGPQPFPIDQLPKVILGSPWEDLMPKVIVAEKPPIATLGFAKRHLEKTFTAEQQVIMRSEEELVLATCEALHQNIAKLKGEIKIIGTENEILEGIVNRFVNEITDEPVVLGKSEADSDEDECDNDICPYLGDDKRGTGAVEVSVKTKRQSAHSANYTPKHSKHNSLHNTDHQYKNPIT